MYLGLCENPGGWGANLASKEKVIPASSVVRRHQSKLRSLPWQPRLSYRSLGCRCGMPVCERTRSARCTASEYKDASGCKDDTRLRGLLLGRVRRKRRWRASRSSRCWASASAWCSKRRTKVGALLLLAADRCSLEYHSSSVHTAASCCAAAYSPRRARALQVSSRSEEAAEITVCSMWVTEAGRRTAHVQFVPHT